MISSTETLNDVLLRRERLLRTGLLMASQTLLVSPFASPPSFSTFKNVNSSLFSGLGYNQLTVLRQFHRVTQIIHVQDRKPKVRAQDSSASAFPDDGADSRSESDELPSGINIVHDQNWLLRLLIVAVFAAAAFTAISVLQLDGHSWNAESSSLFVTKKAEIGAHFQLNIFGTTIRFGPHCPGWVYFWLLMAAGFGLFVSEEALNVWVGATLARLLIFNGVWKDFLASAYGNAAHIFSTIFWIYWGVCISDMVPFYAGRFAAQTKTGDKLRRKVGVSEEKLERITSVVQRYGDLIGFVERFSLGVRNPTSFLAGAMGVLPEKFFTGVCLGALITVPIQLSVGFLFRERPMAALAGVGAVVGIWTIFPYATAGLASIVYVIRSKFTKHSSKS